MRILIVGLNFHPELTGIGKYTAEMAAYLGDAGHQVHVVTTAPYYPEWTVQAGYRGWGYQREDWQGMTVYRCPLWVPRKPTGLKRLLHLLSFALSSFPVLLGQVFWRPDVVVCVAPAFFSVPFAWIAARLSAAQAWLHIQDFELEAATGLGILRADQFLVRWAGSVESWMLMRFDTVSTISERMLSRLKEKGVKPDRAYLFPNWVDTDSIFPLTDPPESLRQIFDLPPDKFIVLYAGNMGIKQGLETLLGAARELLQRPEILFVFCGQGSARDGLEHASRGLPNVRFLPLQPLEKLNQLLNSADVHLLPQKSDAADLVMPSKLSGMLASGKAVIATADAGTEVGSVVSQVGVIVPPGDPVALARAILELSESPATRTLLGEKGRAYALEHCNAARVLERFHAQLRDL
jgi:colanic acid biosynthesis glycosyl transferase WcaI